MSVHRVQREMQEAAVNALTAGDTDGCRRWSMRLFERARVRGDTGVQAQAALLLARSQWVASNPAAAYQWSESAERLAARSHASELVAAALDLQSCSASELGWEDLAITCSERSLSMRSSDATGMDAVNALNYLAVAHTWRRQVDTALVRFCEALEVARESRRGELQFQPLVNQGILAFLTLKWNEGTGDKPQHQMAREQLFHDVEACQKLMSKGGIGAVNIGMENILLVIFFALQAYAHLQGGRGDAADEYLQACRERGRRFKRRHWVLAFVNWIESECARHAGQIHYARAAARSMEMTAGLGGHRQFQLLAREHNAMMSEPVNDASRNNSIGL